MAGAAVVNPAGAAVGVTMDNSSVWHNFTAWTAQHIPYLNMTRLAPSIEDLVLAGPRMVMKLGRLGSFMSIPDAVDGFGQRVIPEATTGGAAAGGGIAGVSGFVVDATTTAAESANPDLAAAAAAGAASAAASAASASAAASRFSLEGARGLGSVFGYATSKWALCCIAMAVVLNRTHIFAVNRRRLRLRLPVRIALRALPVLLLLSQARTLLQSIQCQTSPDFAEMRWGDANKSSELMFSQSGGFLHVLSSALLLGASDKQSCLAVRMVPSDPASTSELRGSLALLWPLFGTFCLSQFLETVSCAVQGRSVAAETGMTLFEHSLAFAEADAAISNQLGWGLFTSASETATSAAATAAAATVVAANAPLPSGGSIGASIAITRSMIMKRANTPPEVLLVAFLSAMSHVTSHILGILNMQSKVRLASTGFYAICFMGSIIWSAVTFSLEDPSRQGLLRFPTVCIIGYIPHVLVLGGILICGTIYSLALVLAALSPPEPATTSAAAAAAGAAADGPADDSSFINRLRQAHGNMQANITLSDIRITMEMDFYTALLRAGVGAITMASEAVYLNEDRRVNLKRNTWLEEERLREFEQLRMQWISGPRYDSNGAMGLVPVVQSQRNGLGGGFGGAVASNGYSRERADQKVARTRTGERVRPFRDGIGAAERSGRWLMAMEYLMHTCRFVGVVGALATCRILARLGLNPPRFLRNLTQHHPKPRGARDRAGADRARGGASGGFNGVDGVRGARGQLVGEWLQGTTGQAYVPRKENVDLEVIVRNQLHEEQDASSLLYRWWLRGGWWGEVDGSGDYQPPPRLNRDGVEIADDDDDPEFDATSVITTTTAADAEELLSSAGDWESDEEGDDDGQRTPTQASSQPAWTWQQNTTGGTSSSSTRSTRESSPMLDSPLAMADLARLLHPRSPEEHDEARALAAHLAADGVVTRSRYARIATRQRAQVLLPPTRGGSGSSGSGSGHAMYPHQRPPFPYAHHPHHAASQKMTPDEEADLLEQILLSQRAAAAAARSGGGGENGDGLGSGSGSGSGGGAETTTADGSSWATGAPGLGPDGPQCVVCHSAARTIIVWPCRCLSLCDDCRVSLAMNNFDKCVCCRRDVNSFSRIFVP